MIKFWQVHETNWSLLNFSCVCAKNENLSHSTLNAKENLLGLLKANGDMFIYEVNKNNMLNPPIFRIEEYVKFTYSQRLTCCEFSKDDNYLAIGLENGNISVKYCFRYIFIKNKTQNFIISLIAFFQEFWPLIYFFKSFPTSFSKLQNKKYYHN